MSDCFLQSVDLFVRGNLYLFIWSQSSSRFTLPAGPADVSTPGQHPSISLSSSLTADSDDFYRDNDAMRQQRKDEQDWHHGYRVGAGVSERSLLLTRTSAVSGSSHHRVSIAGSDDDGRTTESGESNDAGQPWKKRFHRARIFFKILLLLLICLTNIVSFQFCSQ